MAWSKLLPHGEIISEPESWSRTQLDDLVGVELIHDCKKIAIYGIGSYWQSDTYEANVVPFGERNGHCVARRIERFINKPEIAGVIDDSNFGVLIDFRINNLNSKMKILNLTYNLPMWLILEINTKSKEVKYFTSKDKI